MFSETNKVALIQKVTSKFYNIPLYKPTTPWQNNPNALKEEVEKIAYEIARDVAQQAIRFAITELLNELYTHEDFERDLGIK